MILSGKSINIIYHLNRYKKKNPTHLSLSKDGINLTNIPGKGLLKISDGKIFF